MVRKVLAVMGAILLAGAAAGWAAPENMVLGRDGALYKLEATQQGLQLSVQPTEGVGQISFVPQTIGDDIEQVNLGVDEATGSVIALWQENLGGDMSRIQLATLSGGAWFGPVTIAGDDGVRASNPALLVQRTSTTTEDGETVATTIVHMAWWRDELAEDGGFAVYGAVPLNDDGTPALDGLQTVDLHDFLPYAIGCDISTENRPALVHPTFFVDPATGDPHVLFVDLEDCLFEIQQLEAELEPVPDDEPVTGQRRRHVVVFGVRKDIVLPPVLNLAGASFEVGHGMTVVGYWDVAGGIDYIRMDDTGWSEVRTLSLGSGLGHEQAVQLIRRLARLAR